MGLLVLVGGGHSEAAVHSTIVVSVDPADINADRSAGHEAGMIVAKPSSTQVPSMIIASTQNSINLSSSTRSASRSSLPTTTKVWYPCPRVPGCNCSRMSREIGMRRSRTDTPLVRVRCAINARAAALGRYPNSAAAARTASRLAVETRGEFCSTKATWDVDTPARAATSRLVG